MFSFAKYLELLIYSSAIHNLHPSLCEHTAFPVKPWSGPNHPIPRSRFNIVRRFSHKGRTVTLTLAEVKEVFEVRVPRLQILKRKAGEMKPVESDSKALKVVSPPGDAHRALRREIVKWWQGLSEHMDQLEDRFIADHPSTFHKSLPRLPSSDDTFEGDDEEASTPTMHPKPPPSTPLTPTPRMNPAASTSYPFLPAQRSSSTACSEPSSASTSVLTTKTDATITTTAADEEGDSLHLLAGLRHKFQRTEQDLYVELAQCPEKNLNDVRRSFVTAARGATRRLVAWEKKHSPQHPLPSIPVAGEGRTPIAPEPEWWKSGCHAVPGGNIIVREDDWGSIIAFTLRSVLATIYLTCATEPDRRAVCCDNAVRWIISANCPI